MRAISVSQLLSIRRRVGRISDAASHVLFMFNQSHKCKLIRDMTHLFQKMRKVFAIACANATLAHTTPRGTEPKKKESVSEQREREQLCMATVGRGRGSGERREPSVVFCWCLFGMRNE